MFHRTWLRLLQLLGLRIKTTRVKRSSTFNPFGAFSITGVRRGSRWSWIKWTLIGVTFALLTIFGISPATAVGAWVAVGLEFISFLIAGVKYFKWSAPPCVECGCCKTHAYTCEYGRRFYRWEKQGMYLL